MKLSLLRGREREDDLKRTRDDKKERNRSSTQKSSNSHGFFSYIPQRSSEKYQKKNVSIQLREREWEEGQTENYPLFDVIITIKNKKCRKNY